MRQFQSIPLITSGLAQAGKNTHVSPELSRIPHQELQEQAALSAKELRVRILDIRRQILAREVVEDVDREDHGLRDLREVRGGRAAEQEGRRVQEELEEWTRKAGKDVVDDGEEHVGARLGAPGAEDGMRSFEDTNVDFEIGFRKREDEFLGVETGQYCTADYASQGVVLRRSRLAAAG